MPKEQIERTSRHTTAGKIDTASLDGLGLRFSGIITAIGDAKDWFAKDSKEVLGKKLDLQITDGKTGFTYSYKVPEGEKFSPLTMLQIVEIAEVRVMSDMGLNRLLGILVA